MSDVNDLMDGMMAEVQAQLGRTVTLRARAVGTFNSTTGARDRDETDYTGLVAVAGPVLSSRRDGKMIEERTYTFAAADMPHGVVPLETWHVVDESSGNAIAWPIVRVDKGASGRAFACVTRRERKSGT